MGDPTCFALSRTCCCACLRSLSVAYTSHCTINDGLTASYGTLPLTCFKMRLFDVPCRVTGRHRNDESHSRPASHAEHHGQGVGQHGLQVG